MFSLTGEQGIARLNPKDIFLMEYDIVYTKNRPEVTGVERLIQCFLSNTSRKAWSALRENPWGVLYAY